MTTRPRKAPNGSEKLASALLHIRRGVEGDDWLIKGELRNKSAQLICASIDWDHIRRWAEDGTNEPQNLQPLARADHRAKTIGPRGDISEVAKGKRYGKKEAAFRARLLAKTTGEVIADTGKNPKAKIQSRGFMSPGERKIAKERYKFGSSSRLS